MKEEKETKATWFERFMMVVFAILPFFYGMFYEFCGALIFVILAAGISIYAISGRKLKLTISYGMAFGILFLFCYILSVFYAVDSGMALLGVFRIFWIPLLLFGMEQLEEERRKNIIWMVPCIACVMCVMGFVAYFIPFMKEHFYANERLGGAFQYPNTFALYCLVGVVLLCDREKMRKCDYILTAVLTAGIILSGSRIVFVLALFSFVFMIIKRKNRKLLLGMAGLAVVFGILLVVTSDTANIGRITTFSLTDSTLVGRLLYARDALPLLLKHPFGMGYMGYYYMEDSIQTGVYSVMYVHNDLLQIGLDIGWIPMLCYFALVIGSLFSKQLDGRMKLIVAVVFLHGLLDFDMEYGGMAIILFLIFHEMSWQRKRPDWLRKEYRIHSVPVVVCGALLSLFCAYIAVPTIAYYCDDVELAVEAYPWYTEAQLVLLSKSQDAAEVERIADDILKRNDTCALAYQAKATVAYCEDDYEEVIKWQKEAIARDYFNYEEYLNYAYMLYEGMVYGQDHSEKVWKACYEELMEIPDMLERAKKKVSEMGKMIDDKVELDTEEELQQILDVVEDAVSE